MSKKLSANESFLAGWNQGRYGARKGCFGKELTNSEIAELFPDADPAAFVSGMMDALAGDDSRCRAVCREEMQKAYVARMRGLGKWRFAVGERCKFARNLGKHGKGAEAVVLSAVEPNEIGRTDGTYYVRVIDTGDQFTVCDKDLAKIYSVARRP